MKNLFVLILVTLLLISCVQATPVILPAETTTSTETPVPTATMGIHPDTISGKYALPAGQTLLIVGQDLGAVEGYVADVWAVPGGVTTYTNISETLEGNQKILAGLETLTKYGSGDVHTQTLLKSYPDSVLVIGQSIVDYTGNNLNNLSTGVHDVFIDRLGEFIKDAERPVFIRIGYEFDGEWNHSSPHSYVTAFQHIVERLRSKGVDNFASVWQSATYPGGRYMNLPFDSWYPGDEYVDWMGVSYFVYNQYVHDPFLNFAREHNKPVIVAEATPQGFDLDKLTWGNPLSDGSMRNPRSADEIWEEWFAPFFGYIRQNRDVVRAVAYINVDWNSQPMWEPGEQGYWGDSHVQVNELILDRWFAKIDSEFWLHGSSDLLRILHENP
jgi:hypothetical protein